MQEFDKSKRLHRVAMAIQKVLGFTIDELRSKPKPQPLSEARQIFYIIAHDKYKVPYTSIGEYLNRDHSSCITGAKRMKGYIEVNPRLADTFYAVMAMLELNLLTDETMERIEAIKNISQELERLREGVSMLTERVKLLEEVAQVEGSKINWEWIARQA